MRLLLIEDNRRLAELLAAGLAREGWTADVVESGEAAEAAFAAVAYDAVVLDRGLPDGDGVPVLRRLRARRPGVPVLILTALGTVPEVVEGLAAGADDYMVKPVALAELAARLNAAVRRASALPPGMLRIGRLAHDPLSRDIRLDGAPLDLPRSERVVLESLMRVAPKPVAKALLEDRLASFDRTVQANAVEVYVHRLRRRLRTGAAGASIETVRGIGYRLVEAEPGPDADPA